MSESTFAAWVVDGYMHVEIEPSTVTVDTFEGEKMLTRKYVPADRAGALELLAIDMRRDLGRLAAQSDEIGERDMLRTYDNVMAKLGLKEER